MMSIPRPPPRAKADQRCQGLRPSLPVAVRTGLAPAGDGEHMWDQVVSINDHNVAGAPRQ